MTLTPERPAAESTGGGRTLDPAAEAPRPRRAARASVPGGPAAPGSPPLAAGGKTSRPEGSPDPLQGGIPTSPQQRRERVAAAGMPGPETAAAPYSLRGRAAVRARPETPAGASDNDSPPAGSRGLRGAEWQAAAKQAQRRQPSRAAPRAAAKVTIPPPVTGGTVLTATANCLGRCDWTAGPGDPAEVDKAAEKHTTRPPKHPTNTVSVVAEIGGAA